MAGEAFVVMTLVAASGNPEDNADMDYAVQFANPFDSADVDTLAAAFESWWTTDQVVPGTDHSPSDFIGTAWLAAGGPGNLLLRVYDVSANLSGTPHGSPVAVRTLDIAHNADLNTYPSEVAVKMSVHADLTDVPETEVNPTPPPAVIRPAARRRGGTYLPWIGVPFLASTGDSSETTEYVLTGSQAIPSTNLRDTLAAANTMLRGELSGDLQWCVWSRRDATFYPVVGGYIDDAFDTIRKRGPAFTTRTSW